MCEGLGLDREFAKNSEPLYGVKFSVDSFANAAFENSWLMGGRRLRRRCYRQGHDARVGDFSENYTWVPDEALEFYKLHTGVDVEHGILRKEILKKYATTKELQEQCINAQLMKNNMRRVMADCIYMAYVVQGMTCESTSAAA